MATLEYRYEVISEIGRMEWYRSPPERNFRMMKKRIKSNNLKIWRIERSIYYCPYDDGMGFKQKDSTVILAQSREADDTPGTMARLFAEGKMTGKAP